MLFTKKILTQTKLTLRRPLDKFVSKCHFFRPKVLFRVWLIAYQKIMSLRTRELSQIVGIHRLNLSKLWGYFSQLLVFSITGLLKRIKTLSVFMLQRWLAYQNVSKRIRNKQSALDFSFSAQFFFCNMDLNSNDCRIKRISPFSY